MKKLAIVTLAIVALLMAGCSHGDQVVGGKNPICQSITLLGGSYLITTWVWSSPILGFGDIIYYNKRYAGQRNIIDAKKKEIEVARKGIIKFTMALEKED